MNEPKIRIAMRHMETSPGLENHINKQLARVIAFVGNEPTPIFIDFVITPAKVHANNEVTIQIKTPNYEAIIKKEGPEVYTLVDTVCEEMYEKLCEEKRKLVDDHKNKRLEKRVQDDHEYSKKARVPHNKNEE